MIKDRNSKDLTETEEIKVVRIHRSTIQKRSYHDRVVTHLESHNLECEVKWALGSITMNKARGVMEFQLNYFKSYKMML